MLARAVSGEVVQRGRCHPAPSLLLIGQPAAGQVHPQPCRDRLASLLAGRRLHGQRGVVREDHRASQHVALEQRHQGHQQLGRAQRPVAQRLARHRGVVAGQDALDTRQRVVVGVLGHQHVRQQAGAGVAARQRRALRPCRADRAGAASVLAAVLAPHVLQHLQPRRRVLQRLADLLADAHHPLELRLLLLAQVMLDPAARQLLVDGRAPPAAALVALDLLERLGWNRDLHPLGPQLGLQHGDGLTALAEHLALEVRQLCRQRQHLGIGLLAQGLERCCGLHQQVLERLHVIGQARSIDGGHQQLHGRASSRPQSTTGNR
jgi:hypothetical protein